METKRGPQRPDRVLLSLLVLLNIASAATTVFGARQVLPWPLSDVLGLAIQLMLFLALAGFAVRHAVVRRWVVIAVFAAASVYTSFFAYYEQLAGQSEDALAADRAAQAHAAFVSSLYQPHANRLDQVEHEAAALWALSEKEGASGVTTGRVGYGPVARAYAADAAAKDQEAALLAAELERLGPAFTYDLEGLAPAAVYTRDLEAWQSAPDVWKEAVPAPTRDVYLDAAQDVALLTPLHKVRSGEDAAIFALLLSLLVDGVAILLGTAIQTRSRPAVDTATDGAVTWIRKAKDGSAAVRAAWRRPGLMPEPSAKDTAALDDAVQVVVLRIDGRGSDFLMTFYQAIHPESGALDYGQLQAHSNATFRIAARMLVDRLRRPRLGWVSVEDGWWSIPQEHYTQLTSWLGDHIRDEVRHESELAEPEPARTLELVLPIAA